MHLITSCLDDICGYRSGEVWKIHLFFLQSLAEEGKLTQYNRLIEAAENTSSLVMCA